MTIACDNHQDRHEQEFPLHDSAELLFLWNSNILESWRDHSKTIYISIIPNQIVQFIIANPTKSVIPYSITLRLKVHLDTSNISAIAFQVKPSDLK